jgi:pimeloyl-ACP methyl ester carboxylesterase
MMEPQAVGYAPADGLALYYEVYGSGDPLVLLHGGLGAIEMLAPLLPGLASVRQVIAFDLQGHGRTADVDRPLRFEGMADDLAVALDHLGMGSADVMGYSLGGGVALQFALRHRSRLRRLAVVSFPFRKTGWYPEVNLGMSRLGPMSVAALAGSPLHQLYNRIAPKPENWLSLHAKLGELLKADYDWSDAIATIEAPTLLVAGDADSIPPARRRLGWVGPLLGAVGHPAGRHPLQCDRAASDGGRGRGLLHAASVSGSRSTKFRPACDRRPLRMGYVIVAELTGAGHAPSELTPTARAPAAFRRRRAGRSRRAGTGRGARGGRRFR